MIPAGAITFDLNLAQFLSVPVLGGALMTAIWVKRQIVRHIDESAATEHKARQNALDALATKQDLQHAELKTVVKAIETQTTRTNGRVDVIDRENQARDVAIAKLQGREEARAELAQTVVAAAQIVHPSGEHP